MGADVSRVRFDALHDHSGVLMQQGRLLLDADWNELVDLLDRRLRAEVADLGSPGPVPGIAGVAVYPATTPDGFRITQDATGLLIGAGRMYVDGLLAENHGATGSEFDPLLAEPRRTGPVPYLAQPYWPTPNPLPINGTNLVYLDVWQREVTSLEAPDLIEPGVAVDTTTRKQTVWQVRLHGQNTPGITCATADADIPGWPDLIRPSGGRLTTGTVDVAAADDPCALPPTGGYRGLENQTYRVEIHTGGAPGAATFKWSTDNASVASPVVEVLTPTSVRPASLGRDDVLSFKTGDWVEVLDDHYELAQRPGVLLRITVDPDAETIGLNAALPADLQLTPAQAADRHLRVRRWSQRGQIKSATGGNLDNLDLPGSSGAITVSAAGTAVVLDHGVTVKLETSAGGQFRPGDHWIFFARTTSTSVEPLSKAPPRGIHHHYVRLSVVSFPGSPSDCRRPWPAQCDDCGDCTVCVTQESHANGTLTIQAAIDQVTPTGGIVCLATGTYELPFDGVQIKNANGITLRGQGSRTVLNTGNTAVSVWNSSAVTLEDFAVTSMNGTPAIRLVATAGTIVQRLEIVLQDLAFADEPDALDSPLAAIGLGGVAVRLSLRDNVIIGRRGVAVVDPLLTGHLDVSGNTFLSQYECISLLGTVAHVFSNSIHHNTFLTSRGPAVRMLGQVAPDGSVTVADNTISCRQRGIEVAGAKFEVHGNTICGARENAGYPAIAVVPGFGDQRGPVRLADNKFYETFVPPDFNTPFAWAQAPRRMGADKNGDHVWIGNSFGGNLAKVNIHSKEMTLVPLPNPDAHQPYQVAIDKGHNVWTNLWSTDKIAKFDQTTNQWTLFELPTRGSESRYISLLERQGQPMQVFVPYYRARKVAVMTPRSEADLDALKAQAAR